MTNGNETNTGADPAAIARRAKLVSKSRCVRAAYLGHLGRVFTDIDNIPEKPTCEEISNLQERLAASAKKYREASEQLLDQLEEDQEVTDEVTHQTETADKIILAEGRLRSLAAVDDKVERASNLSSSSMNEYAGLPKLDLPTFTGDPLEWRPFLDQFNASVNSRSIPKVQKFTYLWSALKGDARDSIKGISKTDKNYDDALQILKDRFGEPSLLVGLYAEKISGLPYVQEGDLRTFRYIVDTFESCMRELNNLVAEIFTEFNPSDDSFKGIPPIHHLFCTPLFARRLPGSTHKEWLRRTDKPIQRFHLDNLVLFAKKELESLEIISFSPSPGLSPSTSQFTSIRANVKGLSSSSSPVTGAALAITDSQSDETNWKKEKCDLCEQSRHLFKDCEVFKGMSPDSRIQFIKNQKRCIVCLGIHPRKRKPCRHNDRRCASCDEQHNTLLCTSNSSQKAASTSVDGISSSGQTIVSSIIPTLPTTSPAAGEEGIALKIVKTVIKSTVYDRSETIYVYLDDGSKRSYIREDLALRLGLKVQRRDTLITGSFGGLIHEIPSKQVMFSLSGAHSPFELEFNAWTAETLTAPIRQLDLKSLIGELPDFAPWGDQFDGGTRFISLILGADHLTRITGETFHRANSPTIINTFFGSIFFGPVQGVVDSPNLSPALCCFDSRDPVERLWDLEAIGIDGEDSKDYPTPELIDSRYVVKLPFRGVRRPTCNRNSIAVIQPRVIARLNQERKDVYQEKIDKMLNDSVVEYATSRPTEGFYLPHHIVWGRKPRIVFNGSWKDRYGVSLNTCLDPGPNLLGSLQDVLLRYRLRKYPVVADIKAAFHSLVVTSEDRKWIKFLWEGSDFQFCRVPFGLSSSPFLLHSTVIHHVRNNSPPSLSSALLESLYCDDVLRSEDQKDTAQDFLRDSTQLLMSGGMELVSVENPSRVLGVVQDTVSDTLSVELSSICTPNSVTRRSLLGVVSQAFDPLGFISPLILRGRILLQESWRTSLGWDDPLPTHLQDLFWQWFRDLQHCKLKIPRWVHFSSEVSIHIFCDASVKAYAFVVYVVPTNGSPILFYSKSRAAPIRPAHSIPRLELLAATIAARFAKRISDNICQPKQFFLWSDSTCVLAWIRHGVAKRDLFVKNRLDSIASCTDAGSWRYVPTALNPADLASRGGSFCDLDDKYLHGPPFLLQPCNLWPTEPCPPPQLAVPQEDIIEKYTPILDVSRYSSLLFTVGTVGWIRRFVHNCKALCHHSQLVKGPLSSNERAASLQHLVSEHQKEFYPEELEHLQTHECLPRTSNLSKLHIGLYDGILAVFPRTNTQPLPLLHPRSPLAHLVVHHYHCGLLHQGSEATLNQIRQHFWIPTGRSLSRKLVYSCAGCRRYRTVPFSAPESSLQPFRTTPNAPFEECGLDFFGPLFLKNGKKVWVLLITCAVTRALHLELVSSCSAEDTWKAIRKFLARRVKPFRAVTIHSDNAKSFLKVSTMRFPNHLINWKFIPIRSPSWGGWWERLVKTVKNSLRPSIHGVKLEYEDLEAVLTEVEAVINLRPLTAVSSDIKDSSAITPSDFLISSLPPTVDPAAVTPQDLRRTLLHRDSVNRSFWKRWTTQYLASICRWNKLHSKTSGNYPSVGDVVLVKHQCPRGQWPLARVMETFPGRDGHIRSAKVLIRGKTSTIGIHLLYPLEADMLHDKKQL